MPFTKTIKQLKSSKLLSTSAKNSAQVIVRFIFGFINIKVIALFIGPTGMALVSQVQNYLQIGTNLCQLGLNNGIVKFSSQLFHSPNKLKPILSTAFTSTLVACLIVSLCSFFFSKNISLYLLGNVEYYQIIKFAGICFTSMALINFYFSYINGIQQLNQFILLNITLTISGFSIAFCLIYFYGITGLMWGQILVGVVTILFISPKLYLLLKLHLCTFSISAIKKLSKFSVMALVAGILTPLTLFAIRKIIATEASWAAAGLWDGLNKVSTNYILLVTMSFSYYFLPTFAKLSNNKSIIKEVHKSFKTLIPILALGGITIYFSKILIIKLLFTEEFTSMAPLFIWQVIGDFFKILSWIIGYLFISKEKVKLFIVTEVLSSLLQISMAYWFALLNLPINLYYAIENILYFIIMALCFYIKFKPSPPHQQNYNTQLL